MIVNVKRVGIQTVVYGVARSFGGGRALQSLRGITHEAWRFVVLTTAVGSPLVPRPLRWRLMRLYGMDVARCAVSPHVFVGSRQLTVGEGTFINTGCFLDTFARVTIGPRCSLGMQVAVVTSTHADGTSDRRAGPLVGAPVTIGAGTWIGARTLILPGVTIGPGCVIAAGSVVTVDCAEHTLYAGVPARKVRELPRH